MKNILLKVMAVAVVMALGATVAWAQGPAQLTEPSEPTGETVSVTISSVGSATLYTDKALNFEGTGLDAYIAKLSGGEISLSPVSDVPANTGVVLIGEAGDYEIPVAVDTTYSDVSENLLIGFLESRRLASNDFVTYYAWTVLSSGNAGFSKISEAGMNAPAGKAYLKYEFVPVTISSVGSATLYTDKALNFEGTGLDAYIAKLSDGEISLSPVSDVPANTGVVLIGEAGDYEIPVAVDTTYSDVSENMLIGFLGDSRRLASGDSVTYYAWTVLSSGNAGFSKISEAGMNAPAGKAYLKYEFVPVTISSVGSATLYTDKALNFEGTGLDAYIAKLSDGEISLSPVSDVPANTGVVLIGEAGDYEIPVAVDTTYSDVSENMLIGFLGDSRRLASGDSVTYYAWTVLSSGNAGFSKISEAGMNAPAGKAYLKYEFVPVTISSVGSATLYTDKALNFEGTGLDAYIAKLSDGEISLSPVSDVPANTGVVLIGEAGDYEIPVAVDTTYSDVSENLLIGFLESRRLASNDFVTYYAWTVLSSGNAGFSKISEAGMNAPGRKAYLKIDTTMPAANAKTISFGNHVTGIESVGAQPEDDGIYYNLMGVPVENPQKGLYIKNGKKVIVK